MAENGGKRGVAWDRRNAADHVVPSGIYFVKCGIGGHSVFERVPLVR